MSTNHADRPAELARRLSPGVEIPLDSDGEGHEFFVWSAALKRFGDFLEVGMRVFVSAKEGEPNGNGGRWPDAIEDVIPARELITDWAWALVDVQSNRALDAAASHAASLPEGYVRVLLRKESDLFERPRVRLSSERIREFQITGATSHY